MASSGPIPDPTTVVDDLGWIDVAFDGPSARITVNPASVGPEAIDALPSLMARHAPNDAVELVVRTLGLRSPAIRFTDVEAACRRIRQLSRHAPVWAGDRATG